jgi:hypothetical protein
MTREELAEVIKALRVTAEVCGSVYSEEAVKVFVADLSVYPCQQVLGALRRCRREVKGRLTPADVIQRLDDGRPGPEEAWAMMPSGEAETVVWTQEMSQAWGVAQPMIATGERVAARMAFKETYVKLVALARERAEPAQWTASLGTDPEQRDLVVREFVKKGLLPAQHAALLLPPPTQPVTLLPPQEKSGAPSPGAAMFKELLRTLREKQVRRK